MKELVFAVIGNAMPIEFAFSELERYLHEMDNSVIIGCRQYDTYSEDEKGVIWLGECLGMAADDDDAILIDVKGGEGVITGSNARSMLIAAYRFLYELGCRFYRYGTEGDDSGEYIPCKDIVPKCLNTKVSEKASYRHRTVCIEGAVSYEHVKAIINWLPKVGMNGYYIQFKVPHTFFNSWSEHEKNPNMQGEKLSRSAVQAIERRLRKDIKKRGLMLHSVGHGWTCEPLGLDGSGWYETDEILTDDKKMLLAKVGGKRELFGKVPLNTNLCYSNPVARNLITDAILKYCKENPETDYLHFWLADSKNAQCECDECVKMRPADYYIMMLNELDEKLTAHGINTKIVFLIYYDLLWRGMEKSLKNQDRFVLMFAPITRTYSASFTDTDMQSVPSEPEYKRNEFTLPRSVEGNLAFLKSWQGDFAGDSFDFDYHLMWDHVRDAGYFECAKILHRDVCNLDRIGLNGLVSCQVQRAAFPSNLPMYAMAKGLWNKKSDFGDIANEYFEAEFGTEGRAVREYLASLSNLVNLQYMRRESETVTDEMLKNLDATLQLIAEFDSKPYAAFRPCSRLYLHHHAVLTTKVINMLKAKSCGDTEEVNSIFESLAEYAYAHEHELHKVLDVDNYLYVLKASMRPGTVG
ncbi:MAG: DUF4838 domain-containing protein [Clostridia bacterium]|nr:DUF4838 domain-containing protein [Clostridia bacterium]